MTEAALINDNYNSSFSFAPGKTYRLRVINMAGFATFYFDIDGHDMDIIEVDGASICFYSFHVNTLTWHICI